MKSNYLLTESMTNTIVLYILLKKLMQDFEEWDAFKLGIIDKDGKKLKEPRTSNEREAWDLLTRFCWNFKKILGKFIGKSKMVTYLSAAFLLKDNLNYFYLTHNQTILNEKYLKDMTFEKQTLILDFIKEVNYSGSKITEDNFEVEMFKVIYKVNDSKIDFQRIIN